ncbi:MAG: hypothetical protein H7A39_05255 [Chlamydiales bacterium]|nr:hypothetical protein [Chlamydiales bacterium]
MKGSTLFTSISCTLIALSMTSCHVPARYAMRGAGGRTSYNNIIQQTSNEQMLLNLVRLRYCDTPFVLDVSGVTTQFSQKGKIAPLWTIPGFDEKNPFKLGTDYEWQNQPTIQYSPIQGSSYAKQLMQPLNLRMLQRIIYSGWNIGRVFRVAVQNIDSIPNARGTSGPAPELAPEYERFDEVAKLLSDFQRKGQLLIGVHEANGKSGDDSTSVCCQSVQMTFPTGTAEADRLATLLEGTKTQRDNYYINLPVGFTKEQEIGILPRSILGCMHYLSLGIDIPEEDYKCNAVIKTLNKDGSLFDWKCVIGDLFRIYSSTKYPSNAFVAVRYNNYWYYISNYDINSKRTFSLLMQLYNLQSGDLDKAPPPLLTIPIGL